MGTSVHYSEIQRPKREVDRLSQTSAEVKNEWSYAPASTPPDVFMAWCLNTKICLYLTVFFFLKAVVLRIIIKLNSGFM
jgi:hypothetical protein